MQTKRLAILGSRGIPAKYGGFETFAQELSIRLTADGTEVTVFCENQGPARYQNVHLEYVPVNRLGSLSTIVFDIRCLWRARKGFDVVYMLGYGAAFLCFLPRLWNSTVWINMDGVEWRRSKWSLPARLWLKAMEWCATRTASRLVADANGIVAHLRSRYRSLPPISMIPYGVEAPNRIPSATLLDQFGLKSSGYCLIVCRLEPENHVLEIVQGYLGVNTDKPLIVVGGLQETSNYCALLLNKKSDRIRFIGPIYESALLWALRFHCLIYFHGHSVGGTNPSLLEAMAAGNLVVAHDNVFNREVLGTCGEYFTTINDIASGANRLLQNTDFSQHELKQAILARVRQLYSWKRVCSAYADLLAGN